MKKIAVIGAGFAGLTIALRLAQKGFAVDLYEKSSRVGGLLGTETCEHGIAEQAANALMRTDLAQNLFQELGLHSIRPLKKSKRRFIFRDIPRKWPLSFSETVTFLKRIIPVVFSNRASLKPHPREHLGSWANKNLGIPAAQYLLGPAIQGIYANDISGLSAPLILAPFFGKKRKKYRGLLTGEKGMQDLVDALENKLRELGVQIHLGTSVDISSLQIPVVVATSASAAAFLLAEAHPTIAANLKKVPMSSLMSATLFFAQPQSKYQGFGCLIPRGQSLKSLGVLMNSYIFEGRGQTYNETWILGGLQNESLLNLPDAEVLSLLAEERFKILGNKAPLLDYRIYRWPKGLPYYGTELEKALDELQQNPLPKDLFLHGNYLWGIGLSKILEASERLSEEIAGIYA